MQIFKLWRHNVCRKIRYGVETGTIVFSGKYPKSSAFLDLNMVKKTSICDVTTWYTFRSRIGNFWHHLVQWNISKGHRWQTLFCWRKDQEMLVTWTKIFPKPNLPRVRNWHYRVRRKCIVYYKSSIIFHYAHVHVEYNVWILCKSCYSANSSLFPPRSESDRIRCRRTSLSLRYPTVRCLSNG